MRGLEETNDFEEETFTAIAGRGVTYGAQHFEHCTFERCDFGEARFEDCRFYDCTFDRCDLSMMKAPRSAFSVSASAALPASAAGLVHASRSLECSVAGTTRSASAL